ncbi:MAG TPA: trehalose-phosphatase [Roseiarcus sp.]|jgi:trehalose 6-phosphate phosphatase
MNVKDDGQPDDSRRVPAAAEGEVGVRAVDPALTTDTALFLDVDGTLLDIAERPGSVSIPAPLVSALARAEERLCGAVALVSGRTIDEIDRLFSPLRLRASGVHGAEMRLDPEEEPRVAPTAHALPESLTDLVADSLRAFPGLLVEQKTYSLAVHYRGAPETGPQVRAILQRVLDSEPHGGIAIFDAHCAFELRLPGFDKGGAITTFLKNEPFVGRIPIFVGDDTTDEAGFAVVAARGGGAYAVGGWRPGANGVFEDPKAVRAWLMAFANERRPA